MATHVEDKLINFKAFVQAGQQAVTRYLLTRTGVPAEAVELTRRG